MRRMMLAAALLLFAAPVHAALPDLSSGGAAEPAAPAQEIEAEQGAEQDIRIAARIRNIFAAIEPLANVGVEVEQGVVTLTGNVAQAEAAQQAEDIASRVTGVVTVSNRIERDLAVNSNLAPTLGGIVDEARGLVRMLPLILVATVVAVLVALLFAAISRMRWLLDKVTPNAFVTELLSSAIKFIGVLFGLYLALKILGATALLGAVLGIGGVIGIAVGFAVRDTIDNYISSVMLSLRQPFRANDHVMIEGNEGRVVRLTSRATVLMTLNGNHLRIPNSTVFKSVILNYTRNPQRRFEFDLGVDADDNPVDGMATGIEALRGLDFVLDEPEPTAVIREVGDSNIVISFRGWVDQEETDFLKGRSIAIKAAKDALEEAGFALPEPIYRLRFDSGSPLALGEGASISQVPGPAPAAPPPATARKRASGESEAQARSTRPENHIAELVDRERAVTGEADLLDSSRPVE
ncbi:mechanosensitive ion channel family protein [Croceicoccus hydrothermalis]|uniref:mechanosensitive ion channel family protein n=1 Tax=Croceicoccus hydrothermalis TaxID=2867964 RepID=UPI001EFADB0C|nr:mechanosensitive ion channel family protein [Croceicoccus hydrothermalis]